METARNEIFYWVITQKLLFTGGELTYGRASLLGGELEYFQEGKTLHSSNFKNNYLLHTCYLFKLKLFHNCKWGQGIRLKSKTNNGSAPAMRKDFLHGNISGCCILKKTLWSLFLDGVSLP